MTIRTAIAPLLLLSILAAVHAAETSLVLTAAAIDSLYPGTCTPQGCFPSKLPDPSGTVLGFVGGESIVEWRNVTFPSNPLRIGIEYASPQTSSVDFYFIGGPNDVNGILFWMCDLPLTGSYATMQTSVCTIDYTVLDGIDLSGTHDLFVGFRCNSAGCGNYKSVTFYFDGSSGIRTPAVSTRPVSRLMSARSVAVVDGVRPTSLFGNASPTNALVYNVHGRCVGSVASMRTGRTASASGVLIAGSPR